MEKYYQIIKNNILFNNINTNQIKSVIDCLDTYTKTYSKNESIILVGDKVNAIGIVLDGNAKVIKETIDGNKNIIAKISPSDCFGEVFACAQKRSNVSVVAAKTTNVLFIEYNSVINNYNKCQFHAVLIENMLKLIASKNIFLNQKIDILSKRTIRQRLLLYFSLLVDDNNKLVIPLSREDLAAYLNVDRSALSNELSKMQKDGLIVVDKNNIKLNQ